MSQTTARDPVAAPAASTVRVLIVDDSSTFRQALAREIEKEPRFQVVGAAGDGRHAIDLVRRLDPDVVTLDVDMPVMGGLDALRTIVAESSSAVIMLSAQTERGASVTLEALEIGAIDFISKVGGQSAIREKIEIAAVARKRAIRRKQIRETKQRIVDWAGSALVRRDIRIGIIGSSTGGPQALVSLLGAMSPQLRIPFVVAQHMPPNFTEALAKRLDQCTPLRVVHAGHGELLVPGTIYIAPGGSTARVTQGEIRLSRDESGHLYRPSVDVLAASAAAAFGKHVLGIMLTGMGADGAREFLAIRRLGGYTIAQDQSSCVVYGMPKSLIDLDGADQVLPLSEIAPRIGTLLGV